MGFHGLAFAFNVLLGGICERLFECFALPLWAGYLHLFGERAAAKVNTLCRLGS